MAAVIRMPKMGSQDMAEINSILRFIEPDASVGFSPSMFRSFSAELSTEKVVEDYV